MKIQTIKELLSLMHAVLIVDEKSVTIEFKGASMTIDLDIDDSKLEVFLFMFNLNMRNWFSQIKEALAEEKKGGEV